MKRPLIVVLVVLMTSVGIVTLLRLSAPLIDPSFATRATLRFHWGDKSIDAVVTDKDDLRVLKEVVRGRAYKSCPACMFDPDVSVTLAGGRESITLCPSFCRDSLRVGDTDRYIRMSKRKWERFAAIQAKYGIVMP